MDTYSDQKRTAAEGPTLNSFIECISNSRIQIGDGTNAILRQLERLGFYQPQPMSAATAGGMGINGTQVPRERTALDALEHQAVALKSEADTIELISQLLNNQF